ncbi:putative galactinol--sucrose galactosyltransferase 6 [Cyphellophora attinorum]|uniref:Putative galactinol--sucrose galactosyltransferase 6 n=1 Tax=Cyphellophora attinorum TaxID=1664694 RepID=A0A0N1HAG4_9EURO|nr:putative galactinol--sucrose galactosyltransferase 6 [Phialophora attinorum]KPI39617.1 putative galactinol--sucrose galactosyltransferase 6 [Phialophora attinorum]
MSGSLLPSDSPLPSTATSVSPTPALTKPSQIKFYRPAQMSLFAHIATYPPLSQVSIIPPSRKQFNFTVILESSTSFPERPWEVSIWYDHGAYIGNKTPWRALDLQLVEPGPFYLSHDSKTTIRRYCFSGNLDSPFPVSDRIQRGRRVPFTVRYRTDPDSEWQWVFHNFNIADGELILQPPVDPNVVGVSPVDLQEGWSARKLISEAPDARLYSIESSDSIPPAPDGEDAQTHRRALGRVLSLHRWFALVRIWSPWLGPRHGDSSFHLTEPALLISFLRSDGMQVVLLAINGIDDALTTFSSGDNGEIVVDMRNDTTKNRKFKILAGCAWKFDIALASVIYELRKQARHSPAWLESLSQIPTEILDQHKAQQGQRRQSQIRVDSLSSESEYAIVTTAYEQHTVSEAKSAKALRPIDTKTNGSAATLTSDIISAEPETQPQPQYLASWYDSLAYCTWNALGQALSPSKILSALQLLAKANIKVSTLIIDDNWQSLTGTQGTTSQFQRGWTRFEANSEFFRDGLAHLIKDIRSQNPWIKDIAVWHALMGYWGLIAPSTAQSQSEIASTYQTQIVTINEKSPAQGQKTAISPEAIHQLYTDFYTFLSASGVTAVKTDVQFYLDELTSTPDRRSLTHPYLSAWTQAHLRHLSGKAISCMSMTPQILFGQLLPAVGVLPRIVLRTSDDFFPNVETSHPWHVFCNAHNSVLTTHLNVLGDWDMFQTKLHDDTMGNWSGMHAAARAVSGGPIYITDEPGRHDVDLIDQMTARSVRPDEGRVVLRPSTQGKTVGVYDRYEEKGVLKIGVWDRGAASGFGKEPKLGTGILGVFNMAEHEISVLLPVSKFPGLEVEDEEGLQRSSRRGSEYDVVSPGSASGPRSPVRAPPSRSGSRPGSGPSSVFGDAPSDLEDEDDELADSPTAIAAARNRKWVIKSHVTGKITRPVRPGAPLKSDELLLCKLPPRGYDVWTAVPVQIVALAPQNGEEQEIEVAVMGLLGKFTGACAITACDVSTAESGKRVRVGVGLKALGVLGIWVNRSSTGAENGNDGKHEWRKDKMMVMIQNRAVPEDSVSISDEGIAAGEGARIIKVDVEKAWDAMKLDVGWSNEVRVEVLFE